MAKGHLYPLFKTFFDTETREHIFTHEAESGVLIFEDCTVLQRKVSIHEEQPIGIKINILINE
jgi:hypothetical protein